MPRFSLIVPVFNVAPYVRQCISSILEQPFVDFEIIVVNDASTDHSSYVVAEAAGDDPRVTIIDLEKNAGLGNARNVGLNVARGEYVLFVDSDDWLEADALQAIHDRIVETNPDVLFFDYARAYWTGKVQRNVLNHMFRQPGPDVFTLRERPEVIRLLMVAWNKAFRRDFLGDLGLHFAPGYYEDLPVTYPALMAAQRISLLDRVCYFYRQRRKGAITKTVSERHFEVFAKYEEVFAFLDAHPELDEFRSAMFQRTIWHYLIILNRARVPPELRSEFFNRVAEHYARWEPPGFQPPAGLEGREYEMLRRRSYAGFQALKQTLQLQQAVRAKRRKAARRLQTRGRRLMTKSRRAAYRMFLRQPIDERLAVFASYWYRGYSCNPKAIYEQMRQLAPHIRGVWVVSDTRHGDMPEDVPVVVEGSLGYYRVLAQAKYFVNNVNFPDFVVKRPGQVHVQTQHGTPLKTMGMRLHDFPVAAKGMNFTKLAKRSSRWDFLVSSNELSTRIWRRDFPFNYEMLEYGYPRNDVFYAYSHEDVEAIRAELGVSAERTAILYTPTFRDYQVGFQLHLDLARFCRSLGDEFVVLARAHYFYRRHPELRRLQESGALIDVSAHPSVESLCLAADVLISDYSSITFDYANLGRPIVIYAHDWDLYRVIRGVTFDLLEQPPGAV
ncbi:MAG: bifunctional glycosyltransferase family 2 protein/CDP-glycerol:glycerophosphate glycerophosphotransferase, partial [Actinomycetota bacterium]|nr:bifunctional glycosyltransferase family 2 protein/CDP-glycerol:glycerophosphate glycerophosphotransferase [Actinomycetota bacterium]